MRHFRSRFTVAAGMVLGAIAGGGLGYLAGMLEQWLYNGRGVLAWVGLVVGAVAGALWAHEQLE